MLCFRQNPAPLLTRNRDWNQGVCWSLWDHLELARVDAAWDSLLYSGSRSLRKEGEEVDKCLLLVSLDSSFRFEGRLTSDKKADAEGSLSPTLIEATAQLYAAQNSRAFFLTPVLQILRRALITSC